MRIIKLIFLVIVLPLSVVAQGIHFSNATTLKELLEEARLQDKYIFIDCYASWCLPCKKMDNDVFTDSALGKYMNENYISVKFQIDGTEKDKISWPLQKDLENILLKNGITSLPTFYFLNSRGNVIKKETSYKSIPDFKKVALDVRKSKFESHFPVDKNAAQSMKIEEITEVMKVNLDKGNLKFTDSLFSILINDYLGVIPDNEFFSYSNIMLLAPKLNFYEKKLFDAFYNNIEKIDSVVKMPGFSMTQIESTLIKEILFVSSSGINPASTKILKKSILLRYPKIDFEKVALKSKIEWYRNKEKTSDHVMKLLKARFAFIERYGFNTKDFFSCVGLNNVCSNEILPFAVTRKILNKSIFLMSEVIRSFPVNERKPSYSSVSFVDTYASLLFKGGKIKDAISMQEKVVLWMPKNESFRSNLNRMKESDLKQRGGN